MIRNRGPLFVLALLLLSAGCHRGAGAPPDAQDPRSTDASTAAGAAGAPSAGGSEGAQAGVSPDGGGDAERSAVLQLGLALRHADPASEAYDPPRAVEELEQVIAASPGSAAADYAMVLRGLLTHLESQQASGAEARQEVGRLQERVTAAEQALGTCQRGLERIKAVILEGPSAGG